jgi:hypothetical protein
MNAFFRIAVLLIAASATNTWAAGTIYTKPEVKVASVDDARCKKEVSQYIEALQFVRQSAGDEVGTKVMNNYVAVEQLNQLVSSSGYCAGAQLLREKRATR